jgi:hypothetical protein
VLTISPSSTDPRHLVQQPALLDHVRRLEGGAGEASPSSAAMRSAPQGPGIQRLGRIVDHADPPLR